MLSVVSLPVELFTIRRFPSVLRQRCEPVEEFDGVLQELVRELWDTVAALGGGGLAAPQVGVPLRVAVVDVRWNGHPLDGGEELASGEWLSMCLVNPTVTWQSEESSEGIESCYSLPGYCGLVGRPLRATVTARDEYGSPRRFELSGFAARVALHELDHLDGVLYSDRAPAGVVPIQTIVPRGSEA